MLSPVAQNAHAAFRASPKSTVAEQVTLLRDLDKLEAQLQNLAGNHDSVTKFLSALVESDRKAQQQRVSTIYVDLTEGSDGASKKNFESELNEIIIQIAKILGQPLANYAGEDAKKKLYRALLDFFKLKDIKENRIKPDPSNPPVSDRDLLLSLATAFGVDLNAISDPALAAAMTDKLKEVGKILSRIQEKFYPGGVGGGDAGGGGGGGGSKGAGGAGANGAAADSPAAKALSKEVPKEKFNDEGGGAVAANEARADAQPYLSSSGGQRSQGIPQATVLDDSSLGATGFSPPSSGYNNASFNASPSRSGGSSPSFDMSPTLGQSPDHADPGAGRNLASNDYRDYNRPDAVPQPPMNQNPADKKTDPNKAGPSPDLFSHYFGIQPDYENPNVIAQVKAHEARIQAKRTGQPLNAPNPRMLATKTSTPPRQTSIMSQDEAIAAVAADDEQMCKEKLDAELRKSPGAYLDVVTRMSAKISANAKPLMGELLAEAPRSVSDLYGEGKQFENEYFSFRVGARKNKKINDYLERVMANAALLNAVAAGTTPTCAVVDSSVQTEYNNSCTHFSGSLDNANINSTDALKLAALHNFVKFTHIQKQNDQILIEDLNLPDRPKAVDRPYKLILGGNFRLVHNALVDSDFGSSSIRSKRGMNLIYSQIAKCTGGNEWGGVIRSLVKKLYPLAKFCNVSEATNLSFTDDTSMIKSLGCLEKPAEARAKLLNEFGLPSSEKLNEAANPFGVLGETATTIAFDGNKKIDMKLEQAHGISVLPWAEEFSDCQVVKDHYQFYLALLLYVPKEDRYAVRPSDKSWCRVNGGNNRNIH